MKVVKYFFTIILSLLLFFTNVTPVLADCFCSTVDLGNGSKSCQLNPGSGCSGNLQPVCQLNPDGACNHNLFDGGSCVCKDEGWVPHTNDDGYFCTQQGYGAETNDPRVDTALGCIPVKIGPFIQWLLPKFFSIAGGIAFLLMIYGFILMSTSGSDPKKVEGAKETITSAITGLLLSIFALFILRLIAVDILKIPGIN